MRLIRQRPLKHNVAICVAKVRPLRQIEPFDARIVKARDDVCGILAAAIAHNLKFETLLGLPEHRLNSIGEHIGAICVGIYAERGA